MKHATDKHQPQQSTIGKAGFYYGYIIVLCAFIAMIAVYLLPFSYGIYFKPMATELGWNRTIVSGAFSLSRIIAGLFSVAFGWLIDKTGARIVLTICGIAAGVGYLLLSQIGEVWQLFVIYGVIIGASISIFAPMVSTVSKWFVHRRAMMVGIVISGIGVTTLIGPPINNLLISAYGWRLSYIISGIAVAALVIIVAQFMRREPREIREDSGSATNSGENNPKSLNYSYSLRYAVCTRQFWIFFVMSFCYAFCNMALTIHVVPYITDVGISATTAAYVLATVGGINIVGLIVMGYIGDRIGLKKTIVIGFVLTTLATLLLLFTRETWLFYLFAVIFGLATAGIAPQRGPLVAMMFGLKSHGLIFSVADSSFMIGAAVGPLLAGYIFDSTNSYFSAFLLTAVLAVVGLALIVALSPQIRRDEL